jgi:hypothetical protein
MTYHRTLSVACAMLLTLLAGTLPLAQAARPALPTAQLATQPHRSRSGRHTLVVRDAAQRAALEQAGARVVTIYPGFSVLSAPDSALTRLGELAELRDDMQLIMLNTGAIDTSAAAAQAQRQAAGSFDGRRMWLIQYGAPPQPDWHAALLKTGVQVISPIPQNAYLVYGNATQLAALERLAREPFVQWAGPYWSSYRLSPALAGAPEQHVTIQLVQDPQANPGTIALIDSLRAGPAHAHAILHYVNIDATLPSHALSRIAAQPDVVAVLPYAAPIKHDEAQGQIIAGQLSGQGPAAGSYLAWLAGKGFTQAQFDSSGFAVDISDSGIDDGTSAPNHFSLYREGLPGGQSRVIYNRLEGLPNGGSTLAGIDGHGNLNAQIVAGYVPDGPPYNGFPHADSNGFRYGLGVAPFVRVGSSVVFDPDYWTQANPADLIARAYRDGARISSNSWGSDTAGLYDAFSQAYDALVRDAQPAGAAVSAVGNQQIAVVFSAGNDGPGPSSVSSPGTAKNVITVGASEGVRAIGGADGCGWSDIYADNLSEIVPFSARGPTGDGRAKPDIVAPGTHITGGVVQVEGPGPNGTAPTEYSNHTPLGVCGGTGGDPFFPAGQQWYTASSGTSHSAPAVAGAAALVRQWFINHGRTPPSPAMTKAFLLSSARYLASPSAGGSLPSSSQGMGLLDLERAFDETPSLLFDQDMIFNATGQQRAVLGTVVEAGQPLRITLAWTDAPGPVFGSAYMNNLDLRVQIGADIYLGNVFSGPASVVGGAPDARNNVESVLIPSGVPVGTPILITVEAAGIVADGVPNIGGALDQDFALVATNIESRSVYMPSVAVP